MKAENSSSRTVFHVYVPTEERIACNTPDRVRAAIREDWLHRMDVTTICPHCLRASRTRERGGMVATADWLVRSALAGKA
jgi:hypothetical protein